MNPFFYTLIEAAALALALSADALASGFAYGAAKVKIPFASAAIIGLVGSAVLAVSLVVGALAAPFLPANLANYLSFVILSVLGLVKLSCLGANDTAADKDRNKVLAVSEAAVLSVALSLDSLAAGFSAGLGHINPYAAVFAALVFTTLSVYFGAKSGGKLSEGMTKNARFFGLILIVLAISKLL